MDATTVSLHRQLIRLARGMLTAWEGWVNAKEREQRQPEFVKPTS